MAFYAAFWSQAYWYQAYQTIPAAATPAVVDNGWLGGYISGSDKYREEEYRRSHLREQQAELDRIAKELADAEAEKQRLEALKKAKKKAAEERAALLLLQEQEISRLRQRQIWLMRQIQEQEAILAVLAMAARRKLRLVAFN